MWKLLVALALLGFVGLADTLVLTDGTTLDGRLSGVTSATLSFATATGVVTLPLEKVSRISLDFGSDPKPRMDQRVWARALGPVQREFWNCRYIRQGLVVAGLTFIAFGQWLNSLGYGMFENMLTVFGGLSMLWGLSLPQPGCEAGAARLRTLLYIGLERNWLY